MALLALTASSRAAQVEETQADVEETRHISSPAAAEPDTSGRKNSLVTLATFSQL